MTHTKGPSLEGWTFILGDIQNPCNGRVIDANGGLILIRTAIAKATSP